MAESSVVCSDPAVVKTPTISFQKLLERSGKVSDIQKKARQAERHSCFVSVFYEEWAILHCKIKNAFKYSME